MVEVRRTRVSLYVDRTSRQWIVLDPDGNFWMLPNVEKPWDQRQLIYPNEKTELEPVPGHYIHMLGLPINRKEDDP
jgi:hypothetical protein